MNYISNFQTFVNEAMVTVKRKYTENYPAKEVSNYAPVRERILTFIKENSKVTRTQLLEFIRSVNEGAHRSAAPHWISRNENYLHIKEEKGVKYYTLSKLGERVQSKAMLPK